jgi:hypothetical protein
MSCQIGVTLQLALQLDRDVLVYPWTFLDFCANFCGKILGDAVRLVVGVTDGVFHVPKKRRR